MKKTIVVFSNPFGYGPTANAIPIIDNLLTATKGIDIVFAGSKLCREIIRNDKIKIVDIDERDEDQIKSFLKTFNNPYIISSQNRFAIKVANALNMKSAFLDILAWLWKEIPQENLLADIIFWIRFPEIENKIPIGHKINIVSGVITEPLNIKKKNQLIIHIGGAKYPFSNHAPVNYLDMLINALDSFNHRNIYKSVLFVGGSEAIKYVSRKSINKNIIFASMSQREFMKELAQSVHVVTTAGLSLTIESFSQKIPVSFLLPINLSQLALTKLLQNHDACPQYMSWDSYTEIKNDLINTTEKDAINKFSKYAQGIKNNSKATDKYKKDLLDILNKIPDSSGQKKFMEYIGTSGGSDIVNILIKEWNL